jgi:hypothetical protein
MQRPGEDAGEVIDERGSVQLIKKVLKEGTGELPPSGATHMMISECRMCLCGECPSIATDCKYIPQCTTRGGFWTAPSSTRPFAVTSRLSSFSVLETMKKDEKAVLTCPPVSFALTLMARLNAALTHN